MEFDPSRFKGDDPAIQKILDALEAEVAATRRLWPDTIEEEERRLALLEKDPIYAGLNARYAQEGLSTSEKQECFDKAINRMTEIMTSSNPEELITQATDNSPVK